MNYIRKHALELAAKGVDRPAARLFSNPAGDFGSMVNERVRDWLGSPGSTFCFSSGTSLCYERESEKRVGVANLICLLQVRAQLSFKALRFARHTNRAPPAPPP